VKENRGDEIGKVTVGVFRKYSIVGGALAVAWIVVGSHGP
jgi:hypothetical protein